MKYISKVGDLRPLMNKTLKFFQKHFNIKEKPAMAICFTLPPKYKDCHWVTNISRGDSIQLFRETATKMQSQIN